ncbi:hypothetical protein PG993_000600 [Apiospora rasikravindrae]|uniref:Uncharacterized protein n=1 Tax=Apiospora rasikravindrae TaxID=990691 RepID=A0ABR1U907_9PEZI
MASPPLKTMPSSAEPSVRIHPLEGVVVDGMAGRSLHSVCLQQEDLGEEDVVEIRLGLPSPPMVLRGGGSGDQTRPRFVIRSSDDEDDEEEERDDSDMRHPANLDAPPGDERLGPPLSSSSDGQAGVSGDQYVDSTEQELGWRAKVAKEKVAHEVRVAIAEQCLLHPQPKPIAQYNGPMTVVRLDHMAASINLQGGEDPVEWEETQNAVVQPLKAYAGLADWAQVSPREQCLLMEAEVAAQKRREGKETVRLGLRGEETAAQAAARRGEREPVTTPPRSSPRRRSDELFMPLRYARVRPSDETMWIR